MYLSVFINYHIIIPNYHMKMLKIKIFKMQSYRIYFLAQTFDKYERKILFCVLLPFYHL